MNYYMDESGNTGDLINKKNDMGFAKQPIFTHSCIGIDDNQLSSLEKFIINLKKEHNIEDSLELKSQDYYIKNPMLIHDIIEYVIDKKLPLVCEVMDKKYNIVVSIVSHLIFPPMQDESDGHAQFIRNHLADFITHFAPNELYTSFSELCKDPCEQKLIDTMDILKCFFINKKGHFDDDGTTVLMIDETLDDYYTYKKYSNNDDTIKRFVPIPDLDSNGNVVKLLPNVHSFYNQIARINKLHKKKLREINIFHDTSSEFSNTLFFCIENIKNLNTQYFPHVPQSDYLVKENVNLKFIDSKDSIGIQVADIIAGFLNRYIFGLFFKKIEMSDIYHATFAKIITQNKENNSTGINFVLPLTTRNLLFYKFDL